MATLLVRELDDELVRLLKQRAKSHARSAEAEHRSILEAALRPGGESFAVRARRMREETREQVHSDSTLAIRAERDRRWGGGGAA
jgi:plasmid stability protein